MTRRAAIGTAMALAAPVLASVAALAGPAAARADGTPLFDLDQLGQACRSANAAAVACDPIFPALAAHRNAVAVADARYDEHSPNYEKYIGRYLGDGMTDDDREAVRAGGHDPEFLATSDAWNVALDAATEAASVLAHTKPTTLAGLAAAMTHLAGHMVALGGAPEGDTFIDDRLFSAVFATTLSEAAQSLAGA